MTGFNIDVDWVHPGGGDDTWGSDLGFCVQAPNGGNYSWGGFDIQLCAGTIYMGTLNLGTATSGHFQDKQFIAPGLLSGAGNWTVTIGNAYSSSAGTGQWNNIVLRLKGVNWVGGACWPVPAAGPSSRLYRFTGPPTGAPWSWRLRSSDFPLCEEILVSNVPGVTGATFNLAQAFANSINAEATARGCPSTLVPGLADHLHAIAIAGTQTLLVVRAGDNQGTLPSTPSWTLEVQNTAGTWCLPSVTPYVFCQFNPVIEEVALSGLDCNGNEEDDKIDIVTGASLDVDGDGIPDECERERLVCGDPTLTQSTTPEVITAGTSVACLVGPMTSEYSLARSFTIGPEGFNAGCASFGIEQNDGPAWPVHVRLLTDGSITDPYAGLTLLSETIIEIPAESGPDLYIAEFLEGVSFPAGSNMIVELRSPSRLPADGGDGGKLIFGCNSNGQTAPTYVRASFCDAPDFINTATIGYEHSHLALTVQGLVPAPSCPADLNDDDVVDGIDLTLVLGSWNPVSCPGCIADINDDGAVDGSDLVVVLGTWGPCP